jgi:DNA gyrase/topoisomerase IV subunit A
LLLLFTSGRVGSLAVDSIPPHEPVSGLHWKQAALPDESRAGEKLACLMPLAGLPLADYFLQVSRRGCIKKTMTGMSETILANRYIGKGLLHKADQPFEVILARNGDRVALVTWEGRLLALDVESLSYTIEERIKLEPTDHVVAAFKVRPGDALIALTRNGKVLQRELDSLETAQSPLAKGSSLVPPSRLEKGVRLVGAGILHDPGWCLVLHDTGEISLHAIRDLLTAGAIQAGDGLAAVATFSHPITATA